MKTSKAGQDLIKSFEGFSQTAYNLGDGTLTAGWGSTAFHHPIKYVGQRFSTATLQQWFTQDLVKYEKAVDRINQDHVFNQNQYDALVSFAYNLGANVFYSDPGLVTELRAGNPKNLILYRNAGTQFEAGLKRRRQAEINLFNKKVLKPMTKPKFKEAQYVRLIPGAAYTPYGTNYTKAVKSTWGVITAVTQKKHDKSNYMYTVVFKYTNDLIIWHVAEQDLRKK